MASGAFGALMYQRTCLTGCEDQARSPAPASYQPGGIAVTSKGSEKKKKTECSRAQNSLPPSLPILFFQSWCKQPCCLELVPVSGQDRAHRLHSGTAPRLSPPVACDTHLLTAKPQLADNGFYNLMIPPSDGWSRE